MASHIERAQRLAYQLSQLGQVATGRFGARTKAMGLTASDAGVLRIIGRSPRLSQRALADLLGLGSSRLVAVVDSLEKRALVERTRSTADRRNYELGLTETGTRMLAELRTVAAAHEDEMVGSLSGADRAELGRLLGLLAQAHGLNADVHVGTRQEKG